MTLLRSVPISENITCCRKVLAASRCKRLGIAICQLADHHTVLDMLVKFRFYFNKASQHQCRVLVSFSLHRTSPSGAVLSENARLRADCGRLVALLEATSDFQRWTAHTAALRDTHYVSAGESLHEAGVVSEVYHTADDREVRGQHMLHIAHYMRLHVKAASCVRSLHLHNSDAADCAELLMKGNLPHLQQSCQRLQVEFDTEAWHWVPQEAVSAAVAALGRAAPQLPAAPVLALLARLNKIWRKREASAVRAAKQEAQKSAAQAARAKSNAEPWEQAVTQQSLAHTKRQLKRSRALLSHRNRLLPCQLHANAVPLYASSAVCCA